MIGDHRTVRLDPALASSSSYHSAPLRRHNPPIAGGTRSPRGRHCRRGTRGTSTRPVPDSSRQESKGADIPATPCTGPRPIFAHVAPDRRRSRERGARRSMDPYTLRISVVSILLCVSFCSVTSLLRILRQTTRGSNTHSSLHPRGCSPVVIRDSDGCIFPKSRLTNLITPSWHTIALRVLEQFWIQYHHHYHHHHGGILRRVAARFEEVQQPPEFAGSGRENGREAARLRWVGWIDRFVWVEGLWRIRRVVHQHGYARPARHPDAGCAVHGEAASGAGEPRTGDS